jgi:hypothetical protein
VNDVPGLPFSPTVAFAPDLPSGAGVIDAINF